MKTTPLTIEHARAVAALHIEGIDKGFISSLGIEFVTALYEAIVHSKSSFGFAIEESDKVVGFVTFTANLNNLYKTVVVKNGWRFAILLMSRICSVRQIKKICETLSYPFRVKKNTNKAELPSVELLSIVIDPKDCRIGLATQLVRKSLERCRQMGLDKVKVLVGANNIAANRLYQKCGFEFACQINNHGKASNVYQAQTDQALQRSLEAEKTTMYYFASHRSQRNSMPGPDSKAAACVA